MSCPHAETRTVAWLYGEEDDAHAAHVAECPECSALVEQHAEVISAMPPHRLRPAAPIRVGVPRARLAAVVGGGSVLALAAVAVVAFFVWPVPDASVPHDSDLAVVTPFSEDLDDVTAEADALDLGLDSLDADLDQFDEDLRSL